MIFDSRNLPKEIGASDLQDSARLAGIMATFNYYPNGVFDISQYVNLKEGRYERHPDERRYDFSRDQSLCLLAGLYSQGFSELVDLKYVDGVDIFTPAHRGHVKRCQGKKASWFQDLWFWFDVWRASHLDQLGEPNQILCQMMVAAAHGNEKFLKYWLKHNVKWRQAIEDYWCGWRGEPELALKIITFLEGYLK